MLFYILIIAVLNLCMGFVAAVHLGRRYNRLAVSSPCGQAVDATLEDDTEEPDDTATEESVDANSEGSSEKPSNESADEPTADGPTAGDSGEFAADLDALFEEIKS